MSPGTHAPPVPLARAEHGASSVADAEVTAQMRRRQFTALLEHSPQAMMILDAEGRVREWNPAAQHLLGWTRSEVLGGLVTGMIPGESLAEFERTWATYSQGGTEPPHHTVRLHRDGGHIPVRVHTAAIQEVDGRFAGAVSTLSQLTMDAGADVIDMAGALLSRKHAHPGDARPDGSAPEPLVGALECDDLTGLPGRRWLQRRLVDPLPDGLQRAVALLDVDAFALVNQGCGPDIADDVLRELADRLRRLAGPALLGHWQADEFVCIVESADPVATMDALMSRLWPAMADPFPAGEDEFRLTMSGGLASSTVVPVTGLFRSATAALDAAKAGGRERTLWFDAATHQHSPGGSLRLANDLHRGITNGELRLHFQPIVELVTNDVIGVEALVRWERPGVGLLAPGSFIDVAERTGQIVTLGAWVTHQACLAAVELSQRTASAPSVSINVSARQLSDPGLVQMLSEALSRTGCPPANIIVEVTETALLHDMSAATSVLEAIKELGVGLDLDDFGTGYSSLMYLKYFPVDRIKIDQSFVSGLGTDAADTAIVASTIALAHSVGLSAVAEGVESAEQLALLRQLGCDYSQGYLLGRPLPLDQLHAWLAEHVPSRLVPRQPSTARSRALPALDRDQLADQRDQAGDQRDDVGAQRDHVGDQRDQAGDQRDQAGDQRDHVGDERDLAADRRDLAADQRDLAADRRDLAADQRSTGAQGSAHRVDSAAGKKALNVSQTARIEAASDRSLASQDRGLRAGRRLQAERDRNRAMAHRGAGADERTTAGLDRNRALVDRAASAEERKFASVDALTGGYLRDAGLLALQRAMSRAQRTGQLLVVACIVVDDLQSINDSRGHAGGDAVLVGVANALSATLRSTDLIIRSGPSTFVCALPRLRAITVRKRLAVIQLALAGPPRLGAVSVGIAQFQMGDSIEQLLARAESALTSNLREVPSGAVVVSARHS